MGAWFYQKWAWHPKFSRTSARIIYQNPPLEIPGSATAGQPIATIKAVHTPAKASSDDASGLEAVVCLTKSARVMLTTNLWGLVNGAMGTIATTEVEGPTRSTTGCDVKFDRYTALHDGTVPLRRTWSNSGVQYSLS